MGDMIGLSIMVAEPKKLCRLDWGRGGLSVTRDVHERRLGRDDRLVVVGDKRIWKGNLLSFIVYGQRNSYN